MYKTFRDMPVWLNAVNIASEIFDLTRELPRSEDYGLTSQIRRSSNSVSACIAEGFGRETNKDKSNFYIIARGSSYETQSHLLHGTKVGYFDSDVSNHLIHEYDDLIYELNKLIKSLR